MQCRKIPEGVHLRLEYSFFGTGLYLYLFSKLCLKSFRNSEYSKMSSHKFLFRTPLNHSDIYFKLFKFDKRFIARSKEDNQGFHFEFGTAGLGSASTGPLSATDFALSPPLECGFEALTPDYSPKLCTPRAFHCNSILFKTW